MSEAVYAGRIQDRVRARRETRRALIAIAVGALFSIGFCTFLANFDRFIGINPVSSFLGGEDRKPAGLLGLVGINTMKVADGDAVVVVTSLLLLIASLNVAVAASEWVLPDGNSGSARYYLWNETLQSIVALASMMSATVALNHLLGSTSALSIFLMFLTGLGMWMAAAVTQRSQGNKDWLIEEIYAINAALDTLVDGKKPPRSQGKISTEARMRWLDVATKSAPVGVTAGIVCLVANILQPGTNAFLDLAGGISVSVGATICTVAFAAMLPDVWVLRARGKWVSSLANLLQGLLLTAVWSTLFVVAAQGSTYWAVLWLLALLPAGAAAFLYSAVKKNTLGRGRVIQIAMRSLERQKASATERFSSE